MHNVDVMHTTMDVNLQMHHIRFHLAKHISVHNGARVVSHKHPLLPLKFDPIISSDDLSIQCYVTFEYFKYPPFGGTPCFS